mgnify:CR=1 FL=1
MKDRLFSYKNILYKFKNQIFENISIKLNIKTPYSISMENCVLTFTFNENERNEFFKFLEEQYDEILMNNTLIEKKFNEIKTA